MGFFSAPARKKGRYGTGVADKDIAFFAENGCNACPYNHSTIKSPKMLPSGSDTPLVYILGEAPGRNEDDLGEQFVGASGQLLRPLIPKRYKDRVRFNNCIRCRPPQNQTPQWQELSACRDSVIQDIAATTPVVLALFGNVPLRWATGRSGESITTWRGRRLAGRIGGHPVVMYPMLHPSFILRSVRKNQAPIQSELGVVLRLDMERMFSDLDRGVPASDLIDLDTLYDGVDCVTGDRPSDVDFVADYLEHLNTRSYVAVDIETSALRPYTGNSRILSIALSDYENTLAVAIKHRQAGWSDRDYRSVRKLLVDFLRNTDALLIAHNTPFELEWLDEKLRGIIRASPNMWRDTMAQAYVLDERRSGLGLDFLCSQYFGFDLKVQSNLDVTKLDEYEVEDVLKYNALDAKYTHRLHEVQQRRIDAIGLDPVYMEQLRRLPTMVRTQQKGLVPDQDAVQAAHSKLFDELQEVELALSEIRAVHDFATLRGVGFNPLSPDHVLVLMRDILKRPEIVDSSGKASTKEEILHTIDHPIAQIILRIRTLTKLKTTYVDPFIDGAVDGYVYPDGLVHTSLSTTFTSTGRLSSAGPNIQNAPNRKDKWIRRNITVPPDHALLSFDYGQIEARVIAMASMDKFLIKALWEKYDIHMEWSERFAHAYPRIIGTKRDMKDKAKMKVLRQSIKSNFVFPSFYGSVAKSIATNLGVPLHIVQPILDKFWETFDGVRAWSDTIAKTYAELGYVECLTGRRRHAPLSPNMRVNTPVQGTASDIVVDAMNRLSEEGDRDGKPQLHACMNIHDDLSFYLPTASLDDDIERIITVMLSTPYTWAQSVPLSVEGTMGFNWCDKEPIGDFFSNEW